MLNIREILRRLVKYIIFVLVVGFACYSIPEKRPKNLEIFWIMLVSGMMYNIIDIVTPSINLKIVKNS